MVLGRWIVSLGWRNLWGKGLRHYLEYSGIKGHLRGLNMSCCGR